MIEVYDWGAYDPLKLGEIEDALYFHSIDKDRVNFKEYISHKLSKYLVPMFCYELFSVRRELVNISTEGLINVDKIHGHQIKEYKAHFNCLHSSRTLYYLNLALNQCVNVKYQYTGANPSPIFSHLLKRGVREEDNGHVFGEILKTFRDSLKNIYLCFLKKELNTIDECWFESFDSLRQVYSFMKNAKEYQLRDMFILMLTQLFHMDIDFALILELFYVIEKCFKGEMVKTCPGILVYAPPGL